MQVEYTGITDDHLVAETIRNDLTPNLGMSNIRPQIVCQNTY